MDASEEDEELHNTAKQVHNQWKKKLVRNVEKFVKLANVIRVPLPLSTESTPLHNKLGNELKLGSSSLVLPTQNSVYQIQFATKFLGRQQQQ